MIRASSSDRSERARDLWIIALLILVSLTLYLPGIGWGLPPADSLATLRSWAVDEIGPHGPVAELLKTFTRIEAGSPEYPLGNPQYPLFHYVVVAVFYTPYLAFQWLTGGLTTPRGSYPFGFTDPVNSIHMLLLTARGVSVLMGAATVAAGYVLATSMWGRLAGVLAGVFTMLMYPMFYYARTSNVDVPALFWSSVVFVLVALCLRDRALTRRRAVWMGIAAALAVATKDQSYGYFLLFPLILLPLHFRTVRGEGPRRLWSEWEAPLLGAGVAVAVYVVASGFVFYPEKFFGHIHFIRFGFPGSRDPLKYPATLGGYWGLLLETFQHLLDMLGWPIVVAAGVGALICLARDRMSLALFLPLPAFFLAVLVPVRFVVFRYVIVLAFVLACFAARAVAWGLESDRWPLRAVAILILVSGCGLWLLRGADLTYAMLNDSRHEASAWFTQHARPGDRVEFFGPKGRVVLLPRLPDGLIPLNSRVGSRPGEGALQGEFVLAIGPEDQENHRRCPAWVYEGLKSGSLGYDMVAEIRTSFTPHPNLFWVDPRIQIFARRDRAVHIRGHLNLAKLTFGEVHRVAPETHGRPRYDTVLRRLRDGGFEIDSDVFGESADSVAARGTELQAERPA